MRKREARIRMKGIIGYKREKIVGREKMNIGMNREIVIREKREPRRVKRTASWPFPSSNSVCPGKMERKESSSGAPRKIEGMKSRNVCVIDIEVMKITKVIKGNEFRNGREAREARRIAAMRFMWSPGIKPVIVPANRPKISARAICKIMG